MSDSGDQHQDEHEQAQPSAPGPAGDPAASADAGLTDLQARLGELQHRVELLGSQGVWHDPSPAAPPPAGYPEYTFGAPPQAAGPYGDPGAGIPQPPYEAPGVAGPYEVPRYGTDPAFREYEQPPAPPVPPVPGPAAPYVPSADYEPPAPAWEQQYEPPPAYAPPPVATNGHTEDTAEVSARSTTVVLVDAGPFDDLIQLRHFEDELSSLNAVRDVRVRRFGHCRASIEVGMTGPYALARELYRLGRQMEVSDGEAGDLVIDLAPPPEPLTTEDSQLEQPAAAHREEEGL